MIREVPAFPAKATGPTVEPMTSIPSSRFTAFENESPGLWEEGDRVFCRAWRSTADGTKTAVPVLRQAGEHPAPTSLGGFAHEYGQKGNLDSAWAGTAAGTRARGRLLCKTAADRYQTVAGLECDLRRIVADWESARSVDMFPL